MSSVSPINTSVRISYNSYGNFASGKAVSSAAQGAAELSIINKQDSQAGGLQTGANNVATTNDMLKIADGAAAGITDYLQRIRELAVQASNTATLSDSQRGAIQYEIDLMKQGITDIAKQTSFNTKSLLDGSESEFHVTTDANGNGMSVNMPSATLDELGIADFDVTGSFNIEDIDKAIEKISAGRSSMGAQTNALEHAYNYLNSTRINTIGAKSRLEDLDIPQAISDMKKKQTLQEYAMMMQRKRMEEEENRMRGFFI